MARDPKYTAAQMLIRKPATEVYNAMINPAITTNFWFTKSSGILENNKTVTWEWEMYGASAQVHVTEIIADKKIAFDWGNPKRHVAFAFNALSENQTYVTVTETGYTETDDELLAAIRDSTGEFTTVLDGMKAYLEHGINLNLIGDKFASGE